MKLPVVFWDRFKALVPAYKTLNGLRLHYLLERLSLRTSAHATCSSQALLLWVAMSREAKKPVTRNCVFSVMTIIMEWAPARGMSGPPHSYLKRMLKTVLF